jgi:hypothetical protein
MKNWILKKIFGNFGQIANGQIQRSGQPILFWLKVRYYFFPFKSVINMAWRPKYDSDDAKEMAWCQSKGIEYVSFNFGAGGPQPYEHLADMALEHVDKLPKPLWIHCEGGKDRTGGLVIRWMLKSGYGLWDVVNQCRLYKVPSEGWLKWGLEERVNWK